MLLRALVVRVDTQQLSDALLRSDPLLLAGACVVSLLVRVPLSADRWRRILVALDHPISGRVAVFTAIASHPMQFLTPGKAGLLLVAHWLERRHGLHTAVALSSFGLPRVHNLAVLLALGTVGSLGAVLGTGIGAGFGFAGQAAVALVGMVVILAIIVRFHGVAAELAGRVSPRLARWVDGLLAALTQVPPRDQLWLMVYSTAILLFELGGVYLLFLAVGAELGPLHFMFGASAAVVVSNVPLTVGGVGTREAVIMVLFAAAAEPGVLLAGGLLWSSVFYLLPAVLGVPFGLALLRQLGPRP